jgi:hypothetical protein
MQADEGERLKELVTCINDNIKNFCKIGCALKEICDKRLYREISDTFEKFCREHLGISRAYAYKQISAAKVINNLKKMSPNGDIPINEAQVRPLSKLEPNEQKLAWQYAIDKARAGNRKVTSLDVSEGVDIVKERNTTDDSTNSKKKKNFECKKLEKIDLVSKEFKKAYENFFEVIKISMNNEWQTTSKDSVINRLKALIRFLKSH